MWKKPLSKVKRPSMNMQVEGFITSLMELWIGEKEICDALRISPFQLRNWRKKWALPVIQLPSGHLALAKETFLRWMLVLGQHQLEATNRYRQQKRDLQTGLPVENDQECGG